MTESLRSILEKRFAVMGIVNVTPDSFYDGGRHDDAQAAIDHARRLVDEGADILDVGGESTRPGAARVSEDEECGRVLPVVEALARAGAVPVSIDTTKSGVARRAFEAGASWINDISAGRFDPAMPAFAARADCPIVLMHSRGTPRTMQDNPSYADVVAEVKNELLERVAAFAAAGVDRGNIILDPGIGFAKRVEDNVGLLNRLTDLVNLGFPVLVGTSRKAFVGSITGKPVGERLHGTLGSVGAAYERGARLFRVHDVAATRDFLAVLSAIERHHTVKV